MSFMSIDEAQIILDEAYDNLPSPILEGLNLGALLVEKAKLHPQAQGKDLWILGEYKRSIMGSQIFLYYGSFVKVFSHLPYEEQKKHLLHTLFHEVTHHLEYRAGDKSLEIEDRRRMEEYLKNRFT